MKRSQRLEVVLQLYQREEDEAAAAFRLAQSQHAEQVEQLTQLQAYQADYQRRITIDAQAGISMAQWRRTQDYVVQLRGVIRQQEQHVERAAADVERTESIWQTSHLERRAMETMVARISAQEVRAEDRLEQKVMDELVQQMHQRRTR